LDAVFELFDQNAIVVFLLYGEVNAKVSYTALFEDTNRSDTKLIEIFFSSNKDTSIALHFKYQWTLKSKMVVEFDCVDIFELTPDKTRFIKLTIIYDTSPFRNEFNQLRG